MFDGGSLWDGPHDGGSPRGTGYAYLRGARIVSSRDSIEHLAGNSQREPGNKSNFIALAIIHHIVPFAVGKTIAVLHGDDRNNSASSLDVLLRDVGQRHQPNLAFVFQLGQSFNRRLKRDDGIRSMQLIDVDAVQAQPLETSLNRFAQVRGSCIVGPLVGAGTVPAPLGGNYKASRVRKQRFRNEFLAGAW